uniref:C2H2-type domain-containing protein n=1 Tax=Mola mola TaxID=94237 RepID=A0A3Q3VI80_MOLML
MATGSKDDQPAAGSISDVTDKSKGKAALVQILFVTSLQVHSGSSAPSPSGRLSEDDQQLNLSMEEMSHGKDAPFASPDNQEEGEEGVTEGSNKFYCYLCSITCHNQQNFRSHMNSVSHQQRMMEIQHMSNACLVTLLPRVQESLQGKKEDIKHWCATCHTHFTGSIMEHRRTEEHRVMTAISSCTVCKKHFRTSQIFVEHLQSLEHRQKLEKEKEGCEALGKLTTMETDGFSLDEVEEEEERQRSEGEDNCSEIEDMTIDEQYDPDTVYGSSFFVPVAGFICRLCNKFYHFESSTLHTHCKSVKHFEKFKLKALTPVAQNSLGKACICRWEHTDGVALELVDGKPHETSVCIQCSNVIPAKRSIVMKTTSYCLTYGEALATLVPAFLYDSLANLKICHSPYERRIF